MVKEKDIKVEGGIMYSEVEGIFHNIKTEIVRFVFKDKDKNTKDNKRKK